MKLIFAIDYDKTWTADRQVFINILQDIRLSGHEVLIITRRERTDPISALDEAALKIRHVPIFYTEGELKKDYLAKKNIHPNIWIDDDPASITNTFAQETKDSEL